MEPTECQDEAGKADTEVAYRCTWLCPNLRYDNPESLKQPGVRVYFTGELFTKEVIIGIL